MKRRDWKLYLTVVLWVLLVIGSLTIAFGATILKWSLILKLLFN